MTTIKGIRAGIDRYLRNQSRADANSEARQHQKEQKRPKYGNKKTQIDGRVFDSKAEAARYVDLKRLQQADLISELRCQVPFKLVVNGVLVATYKADFCYVDCEGKAVTEDVKGVRTRDFILKKKLMLACHGINVSEFKVQRRAA